MFSKFSSDKTQQIVEILVLLKLYTDYHGALWDSSFMGALNNCNIDTTATVALFFPHYGVTIKDAPSSVNPIKVYVFPLTDSDYYLKCLRTL